MQSKLKIALTATGLAATLSVGMFIGAAFAAQPHMQAALEALRTARGELSESTHNKGGHRVEALRLVNQAIHEVEQGMDDARY